jgi:hypothetical protein
MKFIKVMVVLPQKKLKFINPICKHLLRQFDQLEGTMNISALIVKRLSSI